MRCRLIATAAGEVRRSEPPTIAILLCIRVFLSIFTEREDFSRDQMILMVIAICKCLAFISNVLSKSEPCVLMVLKEDDAKLVLRDFKKDVQFVCRYWEWIFRT
ncbi:uncharacterized protein G2W53_029295 [Senna tora]|uniref:Uncharacterized protein n=1 Tax=Senna tora TaxID=362788 RepID=A0A834T6Z6_9FABA|nr:uncharacterized protein G2W53_029295 [Senna tora]